MSDDKSINYSENLDFNQSLDDEIGDVEICGECLRPSQILFELKPETYRIARTDFLTQKLENLKLLAFEYFPSLIAYNYRLSEKGPGANDPVKKFMHLKDAWEGAINILYAIVFGEIRAKGVDLKIADVYHSGNANQRFNTHIILTDELKQKLENIRAVVNYSKLLSLGLKSEVSIQAELLDALYELQNNRNHFSHSATPTKEQANKELTVITPLFNKALENMQFLENVIIFRFESLSEKCRVETFKGHHLNKEFDDFLILPDKIPYVITNVGQVVFAKWDDDIFSLSPFIHYKEDDTGHETYLCFYKGKRNGKYCYEPLKLREEITFEHLQLRFDAEKDEIIRLVVP